MTFKVVGLDLETTGLDWSKGHKIIEIAMLTYCDGALEKLFECRFDPERPIEPKAQEVHGISYEELAGEPKFERRAAEIQKLMEEADLIVIHNAGFDAPFVAAEMNAAGFEVPATNVFCTMENSRWACPDGKFPKLGELAFALNIPYDKAKAHGATYDVEVMMACFYEGLKRGVYQPFKETK
jgi:DNA polymerase-3 subunit epsilon